MKAETILSEETLIVERHKLVMLRRSLRPMKQPSQLLAASLLLAACHPTESKEESEAPPTPGSREQVAPNPKPSASLKKATEHNVDEDSKEWVTCSENAQNQPDLNDCALDVQQQAEEERNRVFAAIVKKYEEDRSFIEKLQAAQVAWRQFQAAEFAARFPDPEPTITYGSAFRMCRPLEHATLIRERTKALQQWLSPSTPIHRDICSGSYRSP